MVHIKKIFKKKKLLAETKRFLAHYWITNRRLEVSYLGGLY